MRRTAVAVRWRSLAVATMRTTAGATVAWAVVSTTSLVLLLLLAVELGLGRWQRRIIAAVVSTLVLVVVVRRRVVTWATTMMGVLHVVRWRRWVTGVVLLMRRRSEATRRTTHRMTSSAGRRCMWGRGSLGIRLALGTRCVGATVWRATGGCGRAHAAVVHVLRGLERRRWALLVHRGRVVRRTTAAAAASVMRWWRALTSISVVGRRTIATTTTTVVHVASAVVMRGRGTTAMGWWWEARWTSCAAVHGTTKVRLIHRRLPAAGRWTTSVARWWRMLRRARVATGVVTRAHRGRVVVGLSVRHFDSML